MALSKKEIQDLNDLVMEEVDIPEWKGSVFVRNMSGKDRDAWEFNMLGQKKMLEKMGLPFSFDNLRAALAVRTCCNEKGELLFTVEDITWLGEKSSSALDKIYDAAQRINKLSKADVEELRKNSQASQSGDSPTDSPSPVGGSTLTDSSKK